MALESGFSESTGDSTVASTSFSTKTTLTHSSPGANKDYLYFWRSTDNLDSTTNDFKTRFYNTTSSLEYNLLNVEPEATTDNQAVFGIKRVQYGSSPSSTAFEIQFSCENATNTHTIRDARIGFVELTSNSAYAESEGNSSTTTGDFSATKLTLSITPPSTQDYFLIYSAELTINSNTDIGVRMNVGGTIYDSITRVPQDVTNYHSWGGVKKVSLASGGSRTAIIEYASISAGNTVTIRKARAALIPVSDFVASYYGEQLTNQSRTAATYAAALTLSATLASGLEHMVFASTQFSSNSTTADCYNKLVEASTDKAVNNYDAVNTADEYPYFDFYRLDGSGSSVDWTIQHQSESISTVITKQLAIFIGQTEAASGAYTLTADHAAYTLTGQAAGLAAGRKLAAEHASYSLTGQAATLTHGYPLAAAHGTFTLSGQDAALRADRRLAADFGAFTLSVQDATLTYTPAGSTYTLAADHGSFALSGQDAGLRADRRLTCEPGIFTVTGNDVGLTYAQPSADPDRPFVIREHYGSGIEGAVAAAARRRKLIEKEEEERLLEQALLKSQLLVDDDEAIVAILAAA